MTTSKMEEPSRLTENILHLTLEIICLLTGERCAVVKMASIEGLLQGLYPPLSGEQHPITALPPTCPTPEGNIQQKVLEVICQVMELLTGGERGRSGEILEDLDHSEEDKAAMMDNQPMGGSDKRPTPERRLHPPHHPGDSTQEHHPAGGSDKRTAPERRLHSPHHPGDSIQEGHPAGGSDQKTTHEEPPYPINSHDSTTEEHYSFPHDEGEDTLHIKIKEEETTVSCDQRSTEEMGVTVKEEEDPSRITDLGPGLIRVENISEEALSLCLEGKIEDNNIMDDFSTEDTTPSFYLGLPTTASFHPRLPTTPSFHPRLPTTPSFHPSLPTSHISVNAANPTTSPLDTPTFTTKLCPVCGKCFTSKMAYNNHQRVHSESRPYSCSECGKGFKQKTHLVAHQECHTREQSLVCLECGKSFKSKAGFELHQRFHAGEKIHICPQCGKEYPSKSKLNRHLRHHAAKKPFACTVCDYRGWFRSDLILHFRSHTGEKPFVCPECGKSFRRRCLLHRHQTKNH